MLYIGKYLYIYVLVFIKVLYEYINKFNLFFKGVSLLRANSWKEIIKIPLTRKPAFEWHRSADDKYWKIYNEDVFSRLALSIVEVIANENRTKKPNLHGASHIDITVHFSH